MSKADTWETGLLNLLFKNTDFTGVGDAGGLRGSVGAGSLYVSLHTTDPGEAGTQSTNEISYTGYARVPVTRGSGFTVTGNSVSPAATISFGVCTAGSASAAYFGIGSDVSGAGKLLYSGTVTPTIPISPPVQPQISASSTITED